MTQLIPINEIYPHPDNPRKQLGDLTELAESIKKNGILQNLTVVAGHKTIVDPSWSKSVGKDEIVKYDGYTAIIGHRRLAAAKLAGLTEVPCVLVNMTPREQLRTMLVENILRENLNVYEEAKGFQMMLDLGDSVAEVAEKAGFSQTTIRNRVKLLTLDEKKFKKATERGATLFDYMELDKVEDRTVKNRLLGKIGTDNFKDSLEKAIAKEKLQIKVKKIIYTLSIFAHEIEEADREIMSYVRQYGRYNADTTVTIPEDKETTIYYYTVSSDRTDVVLYRKNSNEENEKAEIEKAVAAEKSARYKAQIAEAKEISDRHFGLRKQFVQTLNKTAISKNLGSVISALAFGTTASRIGYIYRNYNAEILQTSFKTGIKDMSATVEAIAQKSPETTLLVLVHAILEIDQCTYLRTSWIGGHESLAHSENAHLDRCYEMLTALGYKMSDEEKAMQDGTHEIFSEVSDNEG